MMQVRSWARTLDERMRVSKIRLPRRLSVMDWGWAVWMESVVRSRIPELGWNVQFTDGAG